MRRMVGLRTGAAVTSILAILAAAAPSAIAAQPMHGTHEPRTYDEGLVPRFSFEVIELDAGGTLAASLFDAGSGRSSAWRGTERVALGAATAVLACSALLERAEAAGEGLAVGSACEQALSPEAGAEGEAQAVVAELGGHDVLAQWLTQVGDAETRLDDDRGATSTPEALSGHLRRLLGEGGLGPAHRATLLGWMGAPEGGTLAGVPAGWEVGAVTVAADPATTLTLAALTPPGRPPLLIVVAVQSAESNDTARRAIHAEIARIATRNVELAAKGFFD